MALVLNEEQRLLKDTAREFLVDRAPVEELRKLRDNRDELGYSKELWAQISELGWAGIAIPEDYEGLDFGFMGLGAVIEETGRTLTASPLFATVVLGGSAVTLGGSEAQKQSLLPKIASGELTLALALEEGPHHDPAGVALMATKNGDGYTLHGEKVFVLDGHTADHLIVAARTAGQPGDTEGITLFMVEGHAKGLTRSRRIMADSRNTAVVSFDNVAVEATAVLGEVDRGWDVLDPVMDRGRICMAAEMLGGSRECLDRTVEYLQEREQFGVKIGSFQALKHRAAILYTEIELAQSVVLDALSAIDEQRPDLPQTASMAKAKLNDVYTLATNEAVQMHGGIGITDELEIGFFLKRARVAVQILGDTGFHRDRYATLCGY